MSSMTRDEKRSASTKSAGRPPRQGGRPLGEGGRQADPAPAAAGGGYLNICTRFKLQPPALSLDPRLAELRDMRLPAVWLRVAETIGMDAFLAMWRIVDADGSGSTHDEDGSVRIRLRSYSSYRRYQRNAYIRQLAAAGLPLPEIRVRLREQMCENLDPCHMKRIIKGATV